MLAWLSPDKNRPTATLPTVSERRIYRRPWRIDITVREGVPRLVAGHGAGADRRVCARCGRRSRAADRRGSRPRLTRTHPVRRSRARRAERAAHGRARPDRRPVVPAPASRRPSRRTRAGTPRTSRRRLVPGSAGSEAHGFALPPGARLHLGDVVVSVERAVAQAEAGRGGWTGDVRWSPADELRLLVVHGTLHVCGWDHAEPAERAAMRRLEARLLGVEPPR